MSSLSHHGIKGQRWGVRRFQNKDGTLTAAGRKRKQHLIEVGSGKRKRLIEAAKPFGSSGDYSKDVTGLNRRGIHGQVINEDDNTHIIKKGTSIYRTAANPELNDDGTYSSLTKNDVDRYIDYGRSGELPGADKSNLNSMKIFEFSANRDLKIANGKYITEIITDDVKRKMKNGDTDQVKFGKEILESFKRHEEDLNISFAPSEMRRSKEAYSRTEAEKEFDRGLLDKANDRLDLYDKKILDYASGKDYRVIRDRLKREGYDGFIDVEDVTTITNLVRGGANTEYPVVILNANDVLTLKRSLKESETQRRLKRGTKLNMSKGELTNVVQHTSIGGTMYIEGNALILGDSSYLEHHGIKGQRWGVRRFQNKDGSLTNAGRKRLGYETKGAAQTVSKAFKAGVKAGGNAVKAVKAHHEAAEAKKKEKKKEKASQSRLGVLANKDLFTDDELRALNQRFKVEDELKMASIQKGVEIAKAVGTIAQNVGTVAKTYEDVTGQSLSPIKRKAAEEKAKQDAEDRERKIAREDAEEARKAAKEERDIALHEQTLRKAIAAADSQEFTAQKTKAEADSSVLDAIKKGQDFNGGGDAKTDATGKSWVEKATSGEGNPFDKMIYDRDPDYKAAKDAHDEKVEWQQHEKERDARIAARERGIQPEDESSGKQNPQQPQSKSQPQSQPQQKKSDDDDDRGGFAKLKEALPFDKGRYVNRKAAEKAKDVKENAEEERTKKQDEKAAKAAIDTIIKDYQHQDDTARSINPTKYDREVAASVIKGKAKNALNKVTHPVDAVAKKISDKAREEKWTKERAKLFEEYQDNREKLGTEFANEAYVRAKKQSLQNLGYRGEALDKKLNETPFSKKKKAKHDAFSIQNGILFINAGDPYLEHHGVKGMKWGKHLMAGKGVDAEGGGGGGFAEDDEKLKEMAKKAGMSVAEFRTKMASKLGGAASKVGEKVYDAAGGKYKKSADLGRKLAKDESNLARRDENAANRKAAVAASYKRRYDADRGYNTIKNSSNSYKETAEMHKNNAKLLSDDALANQSKYEKSLAGRYDKMKADRARKKSIKQRQDKAFSGTSPKEKKRVTPGKLDKARYAIQRGKQKVYNAAGGKYKEGVKRQEVLYKRADARMRRAQKMYNKTTDPRYDWDRQAADSIRRIHNYEAGREYSKYRNSLAGRYDEFKEKRKKKKAKHFDNTNAIYTEGTRLVVNSKWG